MSERKCDWCDKTYQFYEDHDSVECRDALKAEVARLHAGMKRGEDWIRENLPDAENGAFIVDILLAEVGRLRSHNVTHPGPCCVRAALRREP